jgi:hypothetical protein
VDKHKLLIAQEGRQTSFLIPPLRLRYLCRVVLQSRVRWQGVIMRLASVSPSAVRLLPRRLFTTTPGTGDAHRAAAVRVPSRRRLRIPTTAISAAPAKRPPTNSSTNRSRCCLIPHSPPPLLCWILRRTLSLVCSRTAGELGPFNFRVLIG